MKNPILRKLAKVCSKLASKGNNKNLRIVESDIPNSLVEKGKNYETDSWNQYHELVLEK